MYCSTIFFEICSKMSRPTPIVEQVFSCAGPSADGYSCGVSGLWMYECSENFSRAAAKARRQNIAQINLQMA